ncbi:MAG: hypothetical protein LIO90_09780 [Bacteroidales bacterium]|nr:hypothetical protein [Bacteroidales bacterium]
MNKFYTATSRIEDWPTRYLSYAGRPTRRTRRLAHWCLRQASLERQLSAIVQIWKESGGLDDLLSDWPDI